MIRTRRKQAPSAQPATWLISYSDLVTLLLSFFVLLLSMSVMDVIVLTRISSFANGPSPMVTSPGGKLASRIRVVAEMLRDPETVFAKQERIKDLLFPDELLPAEMAGGDVKENLQILQHPEGVVIVLTGNLLFEEGSSTLDSPGKALLDALTPVIQSVNADVNISGYADETSASQHEADEISVLRAIAVLERFLQSSIGPERFSVSGYGHDKPLYPGAQGSERVKNRRVEILLKTAKGLAKYI